MEDIDPEQTRDDFEVEVEIADLDELDTSSTTPRPRRVALAQPFWLRRRRALLLTTNGVLALLVVIILVSTASVRGLVVGSVFRGPTPTPTLAPGVDLFYVRADPPWGSLFVDGRPTTLPRLSADPPLRFTPGRHLLEWRAEHFLTQQCFVSVPLAATDTCRDNQTAPFKADLSAWVVTFTVSLETIPVEMRDSLIQAVQQALDAYQSTDIVQPGERYVLLPDNYACQYPTGQCYANATLPLKATLSFKLAMDETVDESCIGRDPGCTSIRQPCRLFCGGSFHTSSSTREWTVFTPIYSLWTFAAMDGRLLAHEVPDDSPQVDSAGRVFNRAFLPLHITWDKQGWHVSLPTGNAPDPLDPTCSSTKQQMLTLDPPAINGVIVHPQWQFIPAKPPAAGCVVVGTTNTGKSTTPTATQPVFYYLHRFGVLLAVNKQAQSSGLPFANAYEQQFALKLIGK